MEDNSSPPTLFPLENYEFSQISFSEISLFNQCRFRYKSKHIDKLLKQDQRSTYYLSVGRTLHSVLGKLYYPSSKEVNPTPEKIKTILSSSWISEGYKNNKEMEKWFLRCEEIVNRIVNSGKLNGEVIFTEQTFKQDYAKLLITSRLDRVDKLGPETCRIIDYKFGERVLTHTEIESSLQWVFHYLSAKTSLETKYGLTPVKISFYYLEADEFIEFEPRKSQVEKGLEEIKRLFSKIKSETSFPPKINKYCLDCRFDKICPAINALRKNGINIEDAIAYSS